MESFMESGKPSSSVYYASLSLIIFIYISALFNFIQIRKFLAIFNWNNDFFKSRHPKLNILYIILYLFVLYILNPITLFLSNVHSIKYAVYILIINDISNILTFSIFLSRAWILCFDRIFADNLKNWLWRRELNPYDENENLLIKYRSILQSTHIFIYLLCLFVFIVLSTFDILSYFNIIPSLYADIIRIILLILFLCITISIISKISVVSDEWHIGSELLSTMKSAGIIYIFSYIFYIILYHWIDGYWALLIKLLFICMAHLFVIYYACYWTLKQYHLTQKIRLMQQFNETGKRLSFCSFFTKNIHFQDIVNNKDGLNAFCNHLSTEFGLESMLFLIEVAQFKAIIKKQLKGRLGDNISILIHDVTRNININNSKTHILSAASILNTNWLPINSRIYSLTPYEIALYIYDKYVDESADLCINISFGIRKEIYRYFQQLSQQQNNTTNNNDDDDEIDPLYTLYEIYDAAFTEIWRLIETDSFIRFKGTEEYRRLVSVLFPDEASIANKNLIVMVDDEIKKEIQSLSPPPPPPSFTNILNISDEPTTNSNNPIFIQLTSTTTTTTTCDGDIDIDIKEEGFNEFKIVSKPKLNYGRHSLPSQSTQTMQKLPPLPLKPCSVSSPPFCYQINVNDRYKLI